MQKTKTLTKLCKKTAFILFLSVGMMALAANPIFAIGVCSTIDINTGRQISVSPNPRQAVVGDLNGDNSQDLVVVSGGSFGFSGAVTVLLNKGDDDFTTFTTIPVSFTIGGAALADFNLDGALDLALAASTSGSSNNTPLVVFFGNGIGLFSSPVTFNFQGSANDLEAGDFNSDGLPDIIVANSGSGFGAVTLFLNSGGGSFNFAGNFPVGGSPRDLEVADFNGDGRLDVVTANFNNTGSVLFGTGSGSFQLATSFNLTSSFSSSNPSLAVGDLNNDGRPDLAVALSDSSNVFYVLINNGSGGFAAPVLFTLPDPNYRPRSIEIGQFVGDANLDVAVVVNAGFSDSVSAAVIVPGNGSGGFIVNNSVVAPVGSNPLFITSGDFNGDGRSDLASVNNGSNDVSILINNGNDRYGPRTFPTNNFPNQIAVADFNNDGNLDTVTSNQQQTSPTGTGSTGLFFSFGDGRGGVESVRSFNVGLTQALLTADVNNDSRIDLITASVPGNNNTSTISVFINMGGTTPFVNSTQQQYTVNFPIKALAIGDFNKDGRKDLVATSSTNNSIALLFGAANGTFSSPAGFASPANSAAVTVDDFNRDGNPDLALTGSGFTGFGGVFVLLGNGNGTFGQVAETFGILNNPLGIVSNDFNGDSIPDIAVLAGSSFSGGTMTIVVAFGDGDGTFTAAGTYSAGVSPGVLTSADLNGDNRPDLAVANRLSNSLSVLLNTGSGGFRPGSAFLAGLFPDAVAIGDFNNDGRNDAATANRGGNNFSILLNTCREAVTETDYTGEGRTDFAIFRPSTGTWYVLNNNAVTADVRNFGKTGDVPAPGDYDGDGVTDLAVYRPSDNTWYVLRSSTKLPFAVKWGASGDIPIANDYDGDGRTDIAVYRPSNGTWYVIRSSSPNQFLIVRFGISTDVPVPADYDGDGRADIAVYRNGTWIVLQSSDSSVRYVQFGIAGDVPVPGYYDGDGRADIAVYRNGVWYILRSGNNSLQIEYFGLANDIPQPGDYDGDNRTDIAVWRPSNGNWYVMKSSDRQFRVVNWGLPTDIPVSSNRVY